MVGLLILYVFLIVLTSYTFFVSLLLLLLNTNLSTFICTIKPIETCILNRNKVILENQNSLVSPTRLDLIQSKYPPASSKMIPRLSLKMKWICNQQEDYTRANNLREILLEIWPGLTSFKNGNCRIAPRASRN